MSARRISANETHPVTVESRKVHLSFSENAVEIHKGGIEFQSHTPLTPWTEMTVVIESKEDGRINCSGVVISCNGNKHIGYHISMVFTGMTRQEQLRLGVMALAAG